MLSEEVKNLEEELNNSKILIKKLTLENESLKKKVEAYKHCCEVIIPNKVYTHKERRNTTVKFLDGSSITVRRKVGDKDCIETAIAFCILKQLMPAETLKKLIEEREEH